MAKLIYIDPVRSLRTTTGFVRVVGYAVDTSASSGSGVSSIVLKWQGNTVATATAINEPRLDAAMQHGNQFANSGFIIEWNMPESVPYGIIQALVVATSSVDSTTFSTLYTFERLTSSEKSERDLLDLANSNQQDFEFRVYTGPALAALNNPAFALGSSPQVLANMQVVDGRWEIVNGRLRDTCNAGAGREADRILTTQNFTSASVIVTGRNVVNPSSPGTFPSRGAFGLLARWKDNSNYYIGGYDGSVYRLYIIKIANGQVSVLAQYDNVVMPADYDAVFTFYDSGSGNFALKMDAGPLGWNVTLTATDPAPGWSTGRVGIFAGRRDFVHTFDNFQVKDTSGSTLFAQSFDNVMGGFWTDVSNRINRIQVSDTLEQGEARITLTGNDYDPALFPNDSAVLIQCRVKPWCIDDVLQTLSGTITSTALIGTPASYTTGWSDWFNFATGFITDSSVLVDWQTNSFVLTLHSTRYYLDKLDTPPHVFGPKNLALNRPVRVSSYLVDSAAEAESGDFIGRPAVDGPKAVDGDRSTLWISSLAPQLQSDQGGDDFCVISLQLGDPPNYVLCKHTFPFVLFQVYPGGLDGEGPEHQWFAIWVPPAHYAEGYEISSNELYIGIHSGMQLQKNFDYGMMNATDAIGHPLAGWDYPRKFPDNKVIVFCYNRSTFEEHWRFDQTLVDVIEYGRKWPHMIMNPQGDGIRLLIANIEHTDAPLIYDSDIAPSIGAVRRQGYTYQCVYWGSGHYWIDPATGEYHAGLPIFGKPELGWKGPPLPVIRPGHAYHTNRYQQTGNPADKNVPYMGTNLSSADGWMDLSSPRIHSQRDGHPEWIMVDLGDFSNVVLEQAMTATSASAIVVNGVSLDGFPPSGRLQIDFEQMDYSQIVLPNTFIISARGVNGTMAAEHPVGAQVRVVENGEATDLWAIGSITWARRGSTPASTTAGGTANTGGIAVPMNFNIYVSHLRNPTEPLADSLWYRDWRLVAGVVGNTDPSGTYTVPPAWRRARWVLMYIHSMTDPRGVGGERAKLNELSVWAAPLRPDTDHSGVTTDVAIVRHLLGEHAGLPLPPTGGEIEDEYAPIRIGNLAVNRAKLGGLIKELADKTGKLWRFDRWNRYHYTPHPLDIWTRAQYKTFYWSNKNILQMQITVYPRARVSQVTLNARMADLTAVGYTRTVTAVYPTTPGPVGDSSTYNDVLVGSEAHAKLFAERIYRYENRGYGLRIRTGAFPSAEPGQRGIVDYVHESQDGKRVYFSNAPFLCTGVHFDIQLGPDAHWLTDIDLEQPAWFADQNAYMGIMAPLGG